MIKVDPDNLRAEIAIKGLSKLTQRGLNQAFFDIGKDLKKTADTLIKDKTKKTGRVYIVRLNGRLHRHQASAPGESPANLTGKLRKSLGYVVSGSNRIDFGAGGRDSKVNYAKDLEQGTRKILKRPYLISSITANERNFEKHIISRLEKEFKK